MLGFCMIPAETYTAFDIATNLKVANEARGFWALLIVIVLAAITSMLWAAALLFLYYKLLHRYPVFSTVVLYWGGTDR